MTLPRTETTVLNAFYEHGGGILGMGGALDGLLEVLWALTEWTQ